LTVVGELLRPKSNARVLTARIKSICRGIYLAEIKGAAGDDGNTGSLRAMLLSVIKKMFLWTYARNTWQYDVLCALILAFIFLTPKSWFDNGEPASRVEHQNPVAPTFLLVLPENSAPELETGEIERRVRKLANRTDIQVTNVRKRLDADGRILAYEVDIR
jgi:hypothetical protein